MNLTLETSIQKRCHKNCITSLSLYEDKIASGGKDSTVLVHQNLASELVNISKFDLSETNETKCNITYVDYLDNLVVAATSLGVVNVIDTKTPTVSKFKAHKDVVSCVKFFTDDTNLVVTSGFDRKVRIWDLRNLKVPMQDLIGHTAGVNYIDNLEFEAQDDSLVKFGDNYERILSSSNDRTVRLWNVNRGTHLVFKIPIEMSQNIECCCMMGRKPSYTFAVGLDNEYVLVFVAKMKNYVGSLSVGGGVSVNCIRVWRDILLVGTSSGILYVVKYKFNDDFTKCELEVVEKLEFMGSLNDFKLRDDAESMTVYAAVATEVRLGRWATNLSPSSKNQIVVNQYKFESM